MKPRKEIIFEKQQKVKKGNDKYFQFTAFPNNNKIIKEMKIRKKSEHSYNLIMEIYAFRLLITAKK